MSVPVYAYFLHRLLSIPLCLHLNIFFDHFLVIGVGFDVGAIHKDGVGVEIPSFRNLAENSVKKLVHGFGSKPVLEIIADCGEMGCFFLQPVTKESAVIDICTNSFRCTAQGGQTV